MDSHSLPLDKGFLIIKVELERELVLARAQARLLAPLRQSQRRIIHPMEHKFPLVQYTDTNNRQTSRAKRLKLDTNAFWSSPSTLYGISSV